MEKDKDWRRSLYTLIVSIEELLSSPANTEAELERLKDMLQRLQDMMERARPDQDYPLLVANLGIDLGIRFSRSAVAYYLVEELDYPPKAVEAALNLSNSARAKFKSHIKENKMPEGPMRAIELEMHCREAARRAYEELESVIKGQFKFVAKKS